MEPRVLANLGDGQVAHRSEARVHDLVTVVCGPMSTPRYRCRACGNLTRFDVTVTRRTRSFHHYTLGGELTVEDAETLSETVEDVSCRWCGSGKEVEELQGELRQSEA